jgi:alpha-glucosidase
MINYYHIETAKGRSHDEIMKVIWEKGRDNARTPMQWDSSNKGGFTTGDQTWLGVNPNYKEINVEAQGNDPDSILSFYKKMIRLRKENPLFVYGTYDLLAANHPKLFVYTRRFGKKKALVISNLSDRSSRFRVPGSLSYTTSKLVLHNYEAVGNKLQKNFTLKPYETRVYMLL